MRPCFQGEMVCASSGQKAGNIHLCSRAVIHCYLTLGCYLCSNPYVYWVPYYIQGITLIYKKYYIKTPTHENTVYRGAIPY